ncbi:MAG: Zn-dependent protease with chaperone function [Pseudohongiellaceae bacterium]|jgi:Zn-dependent protease with chaperone function
MNFFSEQDQARRNTKWLVVLFMAAVIALIIVTNVLVAVTFWVMDGQMEDYSHAAELLQHSDATGLAVYFNWQNFGKISLAVCGVLGCVMGFKWLQLSGGGKRVAESLGGRRINPNTDNANEKRVLNVVEEMALASGMPVPAVYLLQGEKGINAFAAGKTPSDAVIGVTQGAVEQFDREQLQGVVAHEFSHILNGDMRLNLQMITLLSGILFVGSVGELLMRSGGGHRSYHSTRRSGNAKVMALGLAFLVIGWLGSFFGGLIKAAVSREREFLADASAVQFTRNPQGIADALKIIGGYSGSSRVFSSNANETSHMFIAEALGSWASFDTHPPLDKRIRKIEPRWNGQMISRVMRVEQPKASGSAIHGVKDRKAQAAMAAVAAAAHVASNKAAAANGVGQRPDAAFTVTAVAMAEQQIKGIPQGLKKLAQEPLGASSLVYSLLLDADEAICQQQMSYISATQVQGLGLLCQHIKNDVAGLDGALRLPLLALAMPALKMMSAPQYKQFKKTLLLMIRADKKFEIFEWSLFQLVRHYLDAEFEKVKSSKPQYKQVKQVANEYALVLSALTRFGHDDDQDMQRAFSRAANTAGLYNIELMNKERCGMDDFIKAVNKLANCYPLLKPKLLKGFADCVKHDGEIKPIEKEVIAAIAAVMDCPQPLLEIDE